MSEHNSGIDPSADQEELTPEQKLLRDNAPVIEETRAKYEDIEILEAPRGFSGIVIVAAPASPKTFENFVNQLAKPETDKAVATKNFAIGCVVYPDKQTIKVMFEKRPAFVLTVSAKAQELCGAGAKELGKG